MYGFIAIIKNKDWNLSFSETLRSVEWQLRTDVSGQPISSVFKGREFRISLLLMRGQIGCPDTSVRNYHSRCVTSQKSPHFIYIAAEAWNHIMPALPRVYRRSRKCEFEWNLCSKTKINLTFFVLLTPCFPKFSNNITIICPHFAISSGNFNIGTLITARAIEGDYFQGLGQAGKTQSRKEGEIQKRMDTCSWLFHKY